MEQKVKAFELIIISTLECGIKIEKKKIWQIRKITYGSKQTL